MSAKMPNDAPQFVRRFGNEARTEFMRRIANQSFHLALQHWKLPSRNANLVLPAHRPRQRPVESCGSKVCSQERNAVQPKAFRGASRFPQTVMIAFLHHGSTCDPKIVPPFAQGAYALRQEFEG